MGINKIKLKQIDADFSGLVGQYGSGYFSTTGQLNSLSGLAFKYSDLAATQFVYQTGNQNISGSKTFFSRPIISGAGVTYHASGAARLGEVVSLAGSDQITGPKTFLNTVDFDASDVTFGVTPLVFVDCTFDLQGSSATNLANALGANLVNTTTNQAIGGVKNFTNNLTIKGTGVLLSGQVNPVYVRPAFSSNERYINFVDSTGSGFKNLELNSGLRYDIINQTLKCKTFQGEASTARRLSGKSPVATINGLTFDGGSNIVVSGYGNSDITNIYRPLLFTSNSTVGYKDLMFNSSILVNPSIGNVSGSSISAGSAGFSGNALSSTSLTTSLNLGTALSTDSILFQFPKNTSLYQMLSTEFKPVNNGTVKLGLSTQRWSEIWCTTTLNTTSDRNLKTEISEIPDVWLDAWQDVDYARYKFKDSVAAKGISGARWHIGLIAQDIYEKFQNHGLDAFEIGMLCYDKWDESIDVNGKIVPSGEIWSIRPDECQFMEMALMRRSLNRLKSGILS
jgi:hypothetical protein